MSAENLLIPAFGIPEITAINFRPSAARHRPRLNLLLPSVAPEHRFGGINTALDFFNTLCGNLKDFESRILLTDSGLKVPLSSEFSKDKVMQMEDDSLAEHQIVAINDRALKTLPVASNDIFIATAWWTAHCAVELMKQQKQHYSSTQPLLYLIQDFEPGFYQWSARYDIALRTYKSSIPTIAVFNSSLLKDFFSMQNIRFYNELYFEPRINIQLKAHLDKQRRLAKKKKILVYGRPGTPRNAFDAAMQGINIWKNIYSKSTEWEMISLGEKHANVLLGNVKVQSLGKVTLDEYSLHLMESAIGLSLMISPHPSYPPLEMAHFGCLTVSNDFANKKWETIHENFLSIDSTEPQLIAERLREACNRFDASPEGGWSGKTYQPSYLSEANQFEFMDTLAAHIKSLCSV